MEKYIVKKPFDDLKQGIEIQKDTILELSDERATEIIEGLESFGGGFIEKYVEPKIQPTAEELAKLEADQKAKEDAEQKAVEEKKAKEKAAAELKAKKDAEAEAKKKETETKQEEKK